MNNEISIIAQFLESMGPEVSGRSASPLSDEQIEMIQKFAEGKLDAGSRDELLPEILGNEKALHELVSKLKAQQ
jgi:hypothetical protein